MESEMAVFFLATWAVGAGLIALTFWLTRGRSWRVRANLRPLALAVTLTPSIVIAPHNLALMPAIAILALGLGSPAISWAYVIALGALPIALIWIILRLLWPTLTRRA